MRRAAKVDANQDQIVIRLRACGVQVEIIKEPVDLMCCTQAGDVVLLEVKNREGRDQLTRQQVEFISRWPGRVEVVYSPDEALAAVLGKAVLA